MSDHGSEDDRLKALFCESTGQTKDPCPSAQQLWEAANGDVTADEIAAITEHLAVCADCTNAWHMTRLQPGESVKANEGTLVTLSRGRLWRRFGTLAAILIAGFLSSWLWNQQRNEEETMRSGADILIRSDLKDRGTLSRTEFHLRWTSEGLPANPRYRVTVMAAQPLRSLVEMEVEETELLVPSEHLDQLAEGSMLFWRVTAVADDGSRWNSGTFIQILGP